MPVKNLAAAALLACLIPVHGFAQDPVRERPQDADQIRRSVKVRQKVIVMDDQGRLFNGKIDSLTADSLTIVAAGRQVAVPYAQILRIYRRGDNVIDGALIGFGVGGTVGYFAARSAKKHGNCTTGEFGCGWSGPDVEGYAALMGAGIGAAAGTVIDLLHPRNRDVYRRLGETRVAVSPTVSRGARAVAVSVTW
jgi:hypothetical protein